MSQKPLYFLTADYEKLISEPDETGFVICAPVNDKRYAVGTADHQLGRRILPYSATSTLYPIPFIRDNHTKISPEKFRLLLDLRHESSDAINELITISCRNAGLFGLDGKSIITPAMQLIRIINETELGADREGLIAKRKELTDLIKQIS